MPRGVKLTTAQEEAIIVALTAKPHALQVARQRLELRHGLAARGQRGHRADRRP
jgi:hypothetical protein